MAKKPSFRQRIPLDHNGVQVNFCKKPSCANFGIPAQVNIKGLTLPPTVNKTTKKKHRDRYRRHIVC